MAQTEAQARAKKKYHSNAAQAVSIQQTVEAAAETYTTWQRKVGRDIKHGSGRTTHYLRETIEKEALKKDRIIEGLTTERNGYIVMS